MGREYHLIIPLVTWNEQRRFIFLWRMRVILELESSEPSPYRALVIGPKEIGGLTWQVIQSLCYRDKFVYDVLTRKEKGWFRTKVR